MREFDTPWKETLEMFWPDFLLFFFPTIHSEINWPRGYESLDKELAQVVRDAKTGQRLADKLFKVWRRNGEEIWVLMHVEVQAQQDPELPERMYVYNYRIFDLYKRPVVSLAILADENRDWRPNRYESGLWGCELSLTFPIVKLLDYGTELERLAQHENPVGLIVLAHLQSRSTHKDSEARCSAKIDLVKLLIDRGFSEERVRQIFRIIDWLLELPPELARKFKDASHAYQQEKKMPYISSLERMAMDEGRQAELLEMIAAGLKKRFPDNSNQMNESTKSITDLERLRAIHEAVWSGESIEVVRNLMLEP